MLLDTRKLGAEEQIVAYQQHLTRLIAEPHTRYLMGQAALAEAQKSSWYEAMECLVRGYQEVIESSRPLVAV